MTANKHNENNPRKKSPTILFAVEHHRDDLSSPADTHPPDVHDNSEPIPKLDVSPRLKALPKVVPSPKLALTKYLKDHQEPIDDFPKELPIAIAMPKRGFRIVKRERYKVSPRSSVLNS